MHVVEKFRREGDAIFYDVTLEDPEVLLEPLVFPTRTLRRNTNANAGLIASGATARRRSRPKRPPHRSTSADVRRRV